jgi:hypothetical protein
MAQPNDVAQIEAKFFQCDKLMEVGDRNIWRLKIIKTQ